MSTTLHLFLEERLPHSLPPNYISRALMLALHRALMEWLKLGTPPLLWDKGCLHSGIPVPTGVHLGPYLTSNIAAANLLPRGLPWRPSYRFGSDRPACTTQHHSLTHTQPPHERTLISSLPPSAHDIAPTTDPTTITTPREGPNDQPRTIYPPPPTRPTIPNSPGGDTSFVFRAIRTKPFSAEATVPAQRNPTLDPSLTPLMTQGDIKIKMTLAKLRHTRRLRACHTTRQSMPKDHRPLLRPASLPVQRRKKTRTPLLPRSLYSMG